MSHGVQTPSHTADHCDTRGGDTGRQLGGDVRPIAAVVATPDEGDTRTLQQVQPSLGKQQSRRVRDLPQLAGKCGIRRCQDHPTLPGHLVDDLGTRCGRGLVNGRRGRPGNAYHRVELPEGCSQHRIGRAERLHENLEPHPAHTGHQR